MIAGHDHGLNGSFLLCFDWMYIYIYTVFLCVYIFIYICMHNSMNELSLPEHLWEGIWNTNYLVQSPLVRCNVAGWGVYCK